MDGQSSTMFGWCWTDVTVLGSQVFGQALMESCEGQPKSQRTIKSHGWLKSNGNIKWCIPNRLICLVMKLLLSFSPIFRLTIWSP